MINVIFSYDYELCWGVWDKVSQSYVTSNVAGANHAAQRLIDLHRKHGIPSTWALVGALLLEAPPTTLMTETLRPKTEVDAFAAYVSSIESASNDTLFRADETVLAALRDEQELFEPASHTFSHLYALESSEEVLEDDFTRFDAIFRTRFGVSPVSLVFPKNQSTPKAISIARRFGFVKIRVNPLNWLYVQRNRGYTKAFLIRLLRFLDSFLPIQECFKDRSENMDPALCVGQYFFRPYFRWTFLDRLHRMRLRFALWHCRRHSRTFHLWSHPHNFGSVPDRALANADWLLGFVKAQAQLGRIQPCQMREQNP